MYRLRLFACLAIACIALWFGMARASSAPRLPVSAPPPAGAGSGMYALTAAFDGSSYLSWLEPGPAGSHALKFARLQEGVWSEAREIAHAGNWFVNWADHPSMAVLSNGSLVAHWLVNNGDSHGSYGYGFRIALSDDGGRRWRELYAGGTDNTGGYSGSVSLLPTPSGFDAVFLGPPPVRTSESDADHTMRLGSLRFALDGRFLSRSVADTNTCSCCGTAMATTARGPIAAYRDRVSGEIRDISIVRLHGDRWSVPMPVHRDGWQLNACPTNGPALAASGSRVATAWFTGAGGVPRVNVAFSVDAGDTFGPPLTVDDGRPVGWPSLVQLGDGTAVVSWLESRGDGRGLLRLKRLAPDGRVSASVTVAESSAGRSTGIPAMVGHGDGLLLAWRTDRIQAALVPIPAL